MTFTTPRFRELCDRVSREELEHELALHLRGGGSLATFVEPLGWLTDEERTSTRGAAAPAR